MASIPLSASALDSLKQEVRRIYDERKSSHLTEALAAALGFNTHAALLAEVAKSSLDPLHYLLDEERFDARMQEFGYPPDPEFSFSDVKVEGLIRTWCPRSYDIEYGTPRKQAWRNIIVAAINEGLEKRLFSLKPEDNRWPDYDTQNRRPYLYDFILPCGLPARASVSDAGFSELAVHVAINPKGDMVRAANAGFSAGDAFATTWLERERGAWVQTTIESFRCRHAVLQPLAAMNVIPRGYGDRGALIM